MNELKVTEIDKSLLAKENFEHSYRIAKMMSESAMVPKPYVGKAQDILLAMEFGRSLGLGILQAVQNIAVINSKPCLYGDGLLAVCSGHPDFEDIIETNALDSSGAIVACKCVVKRKGRSAVEIVFTMDDAKKANLWGKSGPWSQYPSRMMKMRARGFALRDSFSDALMGVSFAEEVQDYQEIDVTPKKSKKTKNVQAENVINDIL